MAELSSEHLANFTAASSALILTQSLRLIRNYRYYNNLSGNKASRETIQRRIRETRQLAFTLHNLMSRDEPNFAPFYVSVAGGINDRLEEIHRKLLFFEAREITDMIPIVDKLRKYWRNFSGIEFYDEELINKLDFEIPETLIVLEKKAAYLPESASL